MRTAVKGSCSPNWEKHTVWGPSMFPLSKPTGLFLAPDDIWSEGSCRIMLYSVMDFYNPLANINIVPIDLELPEE
jgi:hypothetical protein